MLFIPHKFRVLFIPHKFRVLFIPHKFRVVFFGHTLRHSIATPQTAIAAPPSSAGEGALREGQRSATQVKHADSTRLSKAAASSS